jgi:pentatricopeptide repeat protein
LQVIARAEQDQIEEAYFRHARLDVYRLWARSYLEAGQTSRAFALFDEARREGVRRGELLEAEAIEVSESASALLREGRHTEALALLDEGLARQPDSSLLDAKRRAAVMRWALPAFERGDYAEAIRRTTHRATPGRMHEALVNNVRYGYHQWISKLIASGRWLEARRIARRAMADPFLAGRVDDAVPPALRRSAKPRI